MNTNALVAIAEQKKAKAQQLGLPDDLLYLVFDPKGVEAKFWLSWITTHCDEWKEGLRNVGGVVSINKTFNPTQAGCDGIDVVANDFDFTLEFTNRENWSSWSSYSGDISYGSIYLITNRETVFSVRVEQTSEEWGTYYSISDTTSFAEGEWIGKFKLLMGNLRRFKETYTEQMKSKESTAEENSIKKNFKITENEIQRFISQGNNENGNRKNQHAAISKIMDFLKKATIIFTIAIAALYVLSLFDIR